MDLIPNSPELRALRGKEPLKGWVSLFSRRDPERAKRYEEALHLFLGYPEPKGAKAWEDPVYLKRSPNTLRAYRFALAEFFEFVARWHKKIVAPHEVTRKDAFDYAEWLLHRGKPEHPQFDFSLDVERLRDGDTPDELAIYEAIRDLGKPTLAEVAKVLPLKVRREHPSAPGSHQVDPTWLEERMLWLMRQKIVLRTPTMHELRRADPKAGLATPVDPDTFRYALAPIKPAKRATVSQRLAACSSFWKVLQRGENAGDKALLEYNVFDEAVGSAMRGLEREKRESSQRRRPTAAIVQKLLAAAEGPRLSDKRNIALLWFLLMTGTRITETLALRRAEPVSEAERTRYPGWLDVTTDPPTMLLKRKGGRVQRLPLPSYVRGALEVFWKQLGERVTAEAKRSDPAYRFRLLMTEPDAPLFPALALWGKNRSIVKEHKYGEWSYRKGLGRTAVSELLIRLSDKAGLTEQERERVHPHGFRHVAAEAMVAGGKDLRQVQAILGHASILTTEGYLPEDITVLDGQAEVLEWLSKDGSRPHRPGGPRPVTAIRTYGTEVEEREAPKAARELPIEAEFVEDEVDEPGAHLVVIDAEERPRGVPDDAPTAPAPPRLLPEAGIQTSTPGQVSAVIEPGSDPGPARPYEEMARGEKPSDLTWSGRPQSRFIGENYPELPERFGIGENSLLLWWNKDAPLPWPVLAPIQAYPELRTRGFLAGLEALYDEWSENEPSKALSLALWYLYLGSITAGLEARVSHVYSWVSWNAYAILGEDLRAHQNEWLLAWFRQNAPLFTVANRRFSAIPKPAPGEEPDAYWQRIKTDVDVGSSIPTTPKLPDWFFEDDPVLAIWSRDHDEWKAFREWLAQLTGLSPSTDRDDERAEQLAFFEQTQDAEYERAKGMLEQYFTYVDELATASSGDRSTLQAQLERMRTALEKAYRIKAPTSADGRDRQTRIEQLLSKAFPHKKPPARSNVLGDSRMFRPDAFRIDDQKHTIVHTAAFKDKFSNESFGRDSECVMRRVARALWERVRPVRYTKAKKSRLTGPEEQRELFVTMLAHMAYVVPCPPELEAALKESGVSAPRPSDVARVVEERIRRAAMGIGGDTEIDGVARDIVESYLEHVPEPEATEARRRMRGESRTPAERARARKKHIPNEAVKKVVRRDLPHPLRLVAATFWPV